MKRLLIVVVTLLAVSGCSKGYEKDEASQVSGGDPERGQRLVQQYGCQSCHTISAIPGPHGVVGPPLDSIAVRDSIAGKLPNNVQTMEQWLQNPQKLDPQTAMPNFGITEADARDITAFLFTLR